MASKKAGKQRGKARAARKQPRSSHTPEQLAEEGARRNRASREAAAAADATAEPAELESPSEPAAPSPTEPTAPAAAAEAQPDVAAAQDALAQLRAVATPAPSSPAPDVRPAAGGDSWSPGTVARPDRPAVPPSSPATAVQPAGVPSGPRQLSRAELEAQLGPFPARNADGSRNWSAERKWREAAKQLQGGVPSPRATRTGVTRSATPHTLLQPQPVQQPDGAPQPREVTQRDVERCTKMMRATFRIASRMAARRRGVHWLLAQEDLQELSEAWGEGLAPYLAEHADKAPLALGVIALGAVVQERLEIDEQLAALGQSPVFPPIKVEVDGPNGPELRVVDDPRNRRTS